MFLYPKSYDVIVVGAGHAGCEAALSCARMGCETLLVTLNLDTIAQMSCNPAIGGLAKGQMVREIDALGGEMAKNTDASALQFRMLNSSRGPAVRSPRAQCDKKLYQFRMKHVLEREKNLDIKQAETVRILTEGGRACGILTKTGISFRARAVVLTTGTFLRGLMHTGEVQTQGGRGGEGSAEALSHPLKELGFELGRFKTGTPPRVNKKTIYFSELEVQEGDEPPAPFSHMTTHLPQKQLFCWITYTNSETHKIISENLHRSPLYSGQIKGLGPRYCPSIEDKVKRFADRERHQIFLEPEGYATEEIYLNGVSTSLPADVQWQFVRSIKGLAQAEIMRFGYAVEYDYAPPTQLFPTLETKNVQGLFFAGQINGTTGYEEAAAQGLIAGINAALSIKREEPLVLHRDEAYIGVLIDDLVTKGTSEPYRMFTSRAEYRLMLRSDNADLRLLPVGHRLGLIADSLYTAFQRYLECVEEKRPELFPDDEISPWSQKKAAEEISVQRLYESYIQRDIISIEKLRNLEERRIPQDLDYHHVTGLLTESRERLSKVQPCTLGQARRISGVTPADISILLVHLEKKRRQRTSHQQSAISSQLTAER